MNEKIGKYLVELTDQLKIINLEQDDQIKCSQLSIDVCRKALEKLKGFILKHKFKSQAEEISFFKEMKPRFTAPLIYHLKVFKLDSRKLNGGVKIRKKYLLNELEKLKHYFDSNLNFYRYYRTQNNYLDYKYFLRGKYEKTSKD